MIRRIALVIITLCSGGAFMCLFVDHPLSACLFGASGMLLIPALIALGSSGGGRRSVPALPLAILGVYLVGCLSAIFILSPEPDEAKWWLDLPPATIVMLGGLWLVPLPAIALWYARHIGRSLPKNDGR